MCGIVGIIGKENVAPIIIESLKRLEYRGYDSAGIATLVNGEIDRRRAKGKLINLEDKLRENPLTGTIGIGHTRWATHGVPNETNAHPHATTELAIVHNGIIENYQTLKEELLKLGHNFATETDTEIVAALVTQYIREGLAPIPAVRTAIKRLEGAYSMAMIFANHDDLMIGVRSGTPLTIGYRDDAKCIASDAIALANFTSQVSHLDDGDMVVITNNKVAIEDKNGNAVTREIVKSSYTGNLTSKGDFRHFMQKEIFEQPEVIAETISSFLHSSQELIAMPEINIDWQNIERLTITACGTAFYAGMVGKYWFEEFARLSVELDIASEFRYHNPPLPKNGACLFITQSGETLDTLEALKHCQKQNQKIVSIVNVPESTIARASDLVLPTLAGPEIGVASTKAFTTQLSVLLTLALYVGLQRGVITAEKVQEVLTALRELPGLIVEALTLDSKIHEIAKKIAEARDALYIGRGTLYPIALEGALKLKEISYIHAEGYAAGELKHGPIALIDDLVPVIALAPSNELFDKVASNIQEVSARGAKVLMISDADGFKKHKGNLEWQIEMPKCHPAIAPILYSIPIQLLSYHTAVLKGTDVDQPRNLAKSVTVE